VKDPIYLFYCIEEIEAGFNLARRRRRGRNIIGRRAVEEVPGGFPTVMQPWGHINTEHLLTFLGSLVVINGQCTLSMSWFGTPSTFTVLSESNQRFMNIFLPLYRPFPHPNPRVFS